MKRLLTNRWTFVVLSVVVPLWVLLGRIPFNVIGWLTLILFLVVPLVILLLLALSLCFFFRKDIRRSHHLPRHDALPMLVLMASLFLTGIFFIDFGDSEGSVGSILTRLTTNHGAMIAISGVLEAVCLLAAAGAFVWAIARLIMHNRQPNHR